MIILMLCMSEVPQKKGPTHYISVGVVPYDVKAQPRRCLLFFKCLFLRYINFTLEFLFQISMIDI